MKKTVDAIGLACPQPVVMTKKALEAKESFNLLEVYVDNEIAVKNVMKYAKSRGLETCYKQKNEKEYLIEINMNEKENFVEIDESKIQCEVCNDHSNIVVVISSDKMGEGDPSLGYILIKGFLYALTQLDDLPKTIIMYNGGVKLAIEGSQSLEDLRTLENLGVEILSCGTCLKHYELEDKLAIGSATNMYTIAEKMLQAEKIVKP